MANHQCQVLFNSVLFTPFLSFSLLPYSLSFPLLSFTPLSFPFLPFLTSLSHCHLFLFSPTLPFILSLFSTLLKHLLFHFTEEKEKLYGTRHSEAVKIFNTFLCQDSMTYPVKQIQEILQKCIDIQDLQPEVGVCVCVCVHVCPLLPPFTFLFHPLTLSSFSLSFPFPHFPLLFPPAAIFFSPSTHSPCPPFRCSASWLNRQLGSLWRRWIPPECSPAGRHWPACAAPSFLRGQSRVTSPCTSKSEMSGVVCVSSCLMPCFTHTK